MYLNHLGLSAYEWTGESLCPDCQERLIARRGERVIWHWAHRRRTQGCYHEETQWHLTWKRVYHQWPGWTIEQRLKDDQTGKRFRADAFRRNGLRIREFVHSLSPTYVAKHKRFKELGKFDILWIWDGDAFLSAFAREVNRGGMKRLLKRKAFDIWSDIGGLVHWRGQFWRHWKDNIWYPQQTARSTYLCQQFDRLRAGCAKNDTLNEGGIMEGKENRYAIEDDH